MFPQFAASNRANSRMMYFIQSGNTFVIVTVKYLSFNHDHFTFEELVISVSLSR